VDTAVALAVPQQDLVYLLPRLFLLALSHGFAIHLLKSGVDLHHIARANIHSPLDSLFGQKI